MKTWFLTLVIVGGPLASDWAQASVAQDERRSDTDDWINRGLQRDAAHRGLWYGAPGVRAGEDLLGPILELIRRPSGLLDFRPRRIPGSPLDLERADFNRACERGLPERER
jgi:hypothetical protein